MTIRHLTIFVAVADQGSMSAAASSLYLSQPTVSQAIRELENITMDFSLNVSVKSFISQNVADFCFLRPAV